MTSVFARPNKFNLSHTNVLTCDMGALVPFYTQEVLPGDEFRIKTDAQVRLAPMLAPIFGEVDFYTHYFFVPNRTIWRDWESFITNGLEAGTPADTVVPPYFMYDTDNSLFTVGSLFDYLDYPVADSAGTNGASVCSMQGVRFSALPLRVYNKIFNDWYRNEFLQDAAYTQNTSGSVGFVSHGRTLYPLRYRCWPRDYTTSALPFTQLGDPAVLPLGSVAPVVLDNYDTMQLVRKSDGGLINSATTGDSRDGLSSATVDTQDGALRNMTGTSPEVYSTAWIDPNGTLVADLSEATAATVNDVRTAFQLQRILERRALNGNRYVEYLASSFGVRSPDARLQRAEFLGGGKSPIIISEVLQTSAGTQSSPQGNMSGHGFGASRSFSVNKAFTEHGFIMGILSIMPKTSYFQGRRREHARWSWSDYYQPEFAKIGEQALYKSELLCNTSTAGSDTFDNGAIFGYQPRYEEYRRKLSGVHGDFRTNMSYWHLGRVFSSAPALNSDYVSCVPSKRIFAAGEQADRPCWVEMYLDVKAIRPMPKKGTPGLVDH